MATRRLPRGREGRQALAGWLASQGLLQRDLAARLGVTRQAVSMWLSGRGRPRAAVARLLEEVTGGAVRADKIRAIGPRRR
jgi:transcriptional regulator with XRE-family HTH domain